MNKHLAFRFFTLAVFIGLIVPVLIQDGMFMDGQQYACVAKNYAHGMGSFWFPYLSETWERFGCKAFLEHPPLVYAIQSFFFRILGDSIYVERLYSFLTAVTTAFLMIMIWRLLFASEKRFRAFEWAPILLWITIPVCFWSYQNDIQENTMGIFTTLSVLLLLKAVFEAKYIWANLIIAGICVFLGSLCKGLPALFPIGVPLIYAMLFKNRLSLYRGLMYSMVLVVVLVGIYGLLLWLSATARESLTFYVRHRLLYRITYEPSTEDRLFILKRLGLELLPPIGLCLITLIALKLGNCIRFKSKLSYKPVLLFLCIGFSGSLPLLLTPVQNGFYMLAALPYFGLALALLVVPIIEPLFEAKSPSNKGLKGATLISVVLLAGSIAFSLGRIGHASRDEDTLHDVYLIGGLIPSKSIVSAPSDINGDWAFRFYLIRHFDISIDPQDSFRYDFVIKHLSDTLSPKGFNRISLDTRKYCVFKKHS